MNLHTTGQNADAQLYPILTRLGMGVLSGDFQGDAGDTKSETMKKLEDLAGEPQGTNTNLNFITDPTTYEKTNNFVSTMMLKNPNNAKTINVSKNQVYQILKLIVIDELHTIVEANRGTKVDNILLKSRQYLVEIKSTTTESNIGYFVLPTSMTAEGNSSINITIDESGQVNIQPSATEGLNNIASLNNIVLSVSSYSRNSNPTQ